MNILGIIYHPDFGHPAACLLRDGKLDGFVEEERLARVKQAKAMFPGRAITFCLKHGGLRLEDVDRIAFGLDANYYRTTFPFFLIGAALKYRLFERIPKKGTGLIAGRKDLGSGLIPGLKDLLNYHSRNLDQEIAFGLGEAGFVGEKVPPVVYVKHHLAHAASAFYSSGFKEAAVLVFDGHGEQNTTTIFRGRDRELTLLKEINVPHSLGWFYSAFTEYLGWDPNEGEVKLMGLAPFGNPNPELKRLMDDIVRISADDIKIDTDYIFYGKRSYGRFYSDRVVARLGAPRKKTEELTQQHKDIAFAVQTKLEEAGVFLARKAVELAGSGNLCLAGGVALNCKMNGEIHRSGVADAIFVQPISHDAGVALGAAMIVAMKAGDDCRFRMDHLYLGPSFTNKEVEAVLKRNKVVFEHVDDVAGYGAREIAQGRIVGWFQGAMEAGPRALGGRSILADPRDPDMKDKVNNLAKFRENWRPFALSIQEEYAKDYLVKPASSPFMIMAFDVVPAKTADIQSAMHWVDNTTRPQTVSRSTNPRYWQLLEEFRKLTGVPGVLNTSFNVKGEPIVCSPEDALRCFFGTGMDVLIMENCVVRKSV